MSEEPINAEEEIISDDKLWAALAYVPYLNPLVSIVALLVEEKKDRPFIKFHAIQSIVLGIIVYLATPVFGLGLLLAVYMLYLAYKAYQGEYIEVPILTDFIKNQGWV